MLNSDVFTKYGFKDCFDVSLSRKKLLRIGIAFFLVHSTGMSEDLAMAAEYDEKGRSQWELEEQFKQRDIQAIEGRATVMEERKLRHSKLLVPGSPEDCAAFNTWDSRCLVTVRLLNEIILGGLANGVDKVGSSSLPDSPKVVRQNALRPFAEKAFLSALMEESGKAGSFKEMIRSERRKAALESVKPNQLERLRELYSVHRKNIESLADDREFQVFASTDSALMGKLYDSLVESTGNFNSGIAYGAEPQVFLRRELPEDWLKKCDSIMPGLWSLPFPSKFGFILIRSTVGKTYRQLDFQASLPLLLQLANSGPEMIDSGVAVAQYYREHKEEFRKPDTIELEILLVPNRRIFPGKDKAAARDSLLYEALLDRPNLRRKRLKISSLPLSIQGFVLGNYPLRVGKTIGPIELDYGSWHFKVLGAKKGSGYFTIKEAEPRILEVIFSSEHIRQINIASEALEEKDRAWTIDAFGKWYLRTLPGRHDQRRSSTSAKLASEGARGPNQALDTRTSQKDLDYVQQLSARESMDSLQAEWVRRHIRLISGM